MLWYLKIEPFPPFADLISSPRALTPGQSKRGGGRQELDPPELFVIFNFSQGIAFEESQFSSQCQLNPKLCP